jgi:CHAT domain-containing protein/lipopolysaccharide biosynthesis regulator YciM
MNFRIAVIVLIFPLMLIEPAFSQELLQIGKSIDREIKGGEKHSYQIALTSTQYVYVVIEQRGIDVVANLFKGDGKPISEFNSELRLQGKEKIELVAESTDTFRLDIEPKYKLSPAGHYEIRLEELRTATSDEQLLQQARELYAESIRLRRSGKFHEAIQSGTHALEIRQETPESDQADIAQSLNHLANLNFEVGEYINAETFYAKALTIREQSLGPNHPSTASTLNDLAVLYFRRGDFEKAEPCFRRSLAIRESQLGSDHPDVGRTVFNFANFNMERGNFTEAEKQYLRALVIIEKTMGPESTGISQILNGLAILYSDLGDNAKAEPMYRRAYEIYEKAVGPQHPETIITLGNLAILYQEMGDSDKAEPLLHRVLASNEKTLGVEHPYVANVLSDLGRLYLNKKDFIQAEANFRRCLDIRRKVLEKDHPSIAQALYSLADLYYEKGDFSQSESLYQEALTMLEKTVISHPNITYPLIGLAKIQEDLGNFSEAERLYQRALNLYDATMGANHPLKVKALDNLAALYMAKGDVNQAVATQSKANQIAEHNLSLNLARGSEREKLLYLYSLADVIDRTVSLQIQVAPNDPKASELAFLTVLQRKGRVLDSMFESFSTLRTRISDEDQRVVEQLKDTTSQLAKLVLNGPGENPIDQHEKRVKSYEEQRERLEAELSRLSAGYYQQSQPLTFSTIQSAIPDDGALIEFAIYRPFDPKAKADKAYSDSRYIAYVIHHEGDIQWKDLGDTKSIDLAVDHLRKALRDPAQKDVQKRAHFVHQKILEPIRSFTNGATHLLISADGELNLIPFEALVDDQGKYLVEQFSFSYLMSGRDLQRMQVARKSDTAPIVVANPFFGEPKTESTKTIAKSNRRSVTTATDLSDVYFAPLGGTAQEAKTIQSVFPEITMMTGSDATESSLKKINAPLILHIATHGFFLTDQSFPTVRNTRTLNANVNIKNPLLRSGLALAGANVHNTETDDGILTALEASGLDLWGTRLVTLSACDTGVGEVKNGEGVYGLRRAFVLAGTESLIMSLWPVSDYVTRELMSNYYKGLKQGLGRGEALRQVQLEMLKRKGRQHPFYWASFIQSGDWANLEGKR